MEPYHQLQGQLGLPATAVCQFLLTEQADKSEELFVALHIISADTLAVLPALWPQSAQRAADGLSLLTACPRDLNRQTV
jgi:hypothetical protein